MVTGPRHERNKPGGSVSVWKRFDPDGTVDSSGRAGGSPDPWFLRPAEAETREYRGPIQRAWRYDEVARSGEALYPARRIGRRLSKWAN
jgi:hypothetical protein